MRFKLTKPHRKNFANQAAMKKGYKSVRTHIKLN